MNPRTPTNLTNQTNQINQKDVPDYALVYGNPDKIQGWMCACGGKVNFQSAHTKCLTCNKEYGKINNIVQRIS